MSKKELLITFSEWVRLTSSLHELVRNLSKSEINALVEGKKRLSVSDVESSTSLDKRGSKDTKLHNDKKTQINDEAVENLARRLGLIESREEATTLLQQAILQKATATKLAKFLSLPVAKDDSKERILDKIIEGTIGYRLRSKAIQGE